MRRLTVRIRPRHGAFNSFGAVVREMAAIERDAFLELDRRPDGTAVALYRMGGDPEALEPVLEETPDIITSDVFGVDDEQFYVHLHFRPDGPGSNLLALADHYRLIIETPIEFTPDGGLDVSVVGRPSDIADAVEAAPEGITTDVERAVSFSAHEEGPKSRLTDRQLTVLDHAMEEGYYECPRETTQAELAADFGCSAAVINETLRKAEAALLTDLTDAEA